MMRIKQLPPPIITSSDCTILYHKLLSGDLLHRLGGFRFSEASRTRSRWKKIKVPSRHWWQVPTIVEHVNLRNTGDAHINFRSWVIDKFLRDGKKRRALSLGCGYGLREIAWAKEDIFESLLGVDLAPNLIRAAEDTARKEMVSNIVSFVAGDVSEVIGNEKYDVIIFEHSLHHFQNISSLLDSILAMLNDGGFVYIDEYVGPRRLQYTRKQRAFADAALQLIPEKFRTDYSGRWIKNRVHSPGPLMMYFSDPSEAVESDQIMPELRKRFDFIVEKKTGGSIFPLVVQDIAWNFMEGSQAIDVLSQILELDAHLIDRGAIESDYVCIFATPKGMS